MLRAILEKLRGPKTVPRDSRGYDVFVFIKAPTMATSWAAARARREDPADLQSLWEHCPRADWLLKIALAAGLDAALVHDVASKLLSDSGASNTDDEDTIEAVTLLVDAHLATSIELTELEEEEAAIAAGGHAPINDMGMQGDKLFELQHRIDQLRIKVNAELSDPVRQAIPYKQLHGQLYGDVASSPYR